MSLYADTRPNDPRFQFVGVYLAGLKWKGGRAGWKLFFLPPKFWDASVFQKCACKDRAS